MPAHLGQLLPGPEELVALGELADDLIRRVPPALVRCHVVVDSSCPNTGHQSRTTTGPLRRAHLTYKDGTGTPELRSRYNLSQGSVLKILHSHGVTMRRQGITDEQIDDAVHLYELGESLAKIGAHLGAEAGTVRRALLNRGVRMRDTHGRER
ncbi:hypothetical protein MALV_01570 [Mycolicibacterium alvei]|uniref:Helix-turn-helix domain containing protein n=1 Tax=Mycolicibacterium alvei TaxID=67081 RepID=A0A6N4UNN8_9MYCO|nr:hypothetical protein MALV_01570 [Mycolicibacterium alvei]